MNALLVRLVHEAQRETELRRQRVPRHELERRAMATESPPGFAAALKQPSLTVIAEMKARTPLMGTLTSEYSPARLARLYAEGGASALSVLCQEASFGGVPQHLLQVREVIELPLLRKDFITDEYQLVEARAFGAAAALLIVAALTPARLRSLMACARQLAVETLVEAHDEREVDGALQAGAQVVGINHRDLDTFRVDTSLTEKLRPRIPSDIVVVAESGITTREDAQRMREAGADAVLVGEALMRAADPVEKLRELRRTTP